MRLEEREKHQPSIQDILNGLKGELAKKRKGLKDLGGGALIESLDRIDKLNVVIRKLEDSILPSTPGFKAIGTATQRAARGGTLEPDNRSNR